MSNVISQTNNTSSNKLHRIGKYLCCLNQSKAFRAIFPDSKASAKTIHECASRFHHTPEVQYQLWRLRAIMRGEIQRDYQYRGGQGLHKG